jgi:hypothetical protein
VLFGDKQKLGFLGFTKIEITLLVRYTGYDKGGLGAGTEG